MSKLTPQLTKHIKRLREVRDEYDDLKARSAKLYKEKEKLENEVIPQLMEDAELEKATVTGAGSISLKPEVFAYVKVDDQPEFQDWLREHNHSSIIKETVHHASLRSWVKEMIENGEALPEVLNFTPYTKASLRRN